MAIPPPVLQILHFHMLQHDVNGPEGCPKIGTTLRNKDNEMLFKAASLQHVVNGPKGCPNFGTTFGNKDNEMQSKGGLCKLLPSNWNDELLRQEAERHPTPNEIMGAKIAAEGFLRARSHDNIQWS